MPYSAQAPWWVRSEARQMVPHGGGMLGGSGLGRADDLPVNVASGSYVVQAHILSALGDGNSLAGGKMLASFFGTGPLGMPVMHGHGGMGGPHNIRMGMTKMPAGSSVGSALTKTKSAPFAHGGAHPAPPGHTPIMASSAEFIIPPHIVLRIGKGDLRRGHDVLDELMHILHKRHLRVLQRLPGPVKRDAA